MDGAVNRNRSVLLSICSCFRESSLMHKSATALVHCFVLEEVLFSHLHFGKLLSGGFNQICKGPVSSIFPSLQTFL